MSLLIDALRRAEEAKHAAAQSGDPSPSGDGMTLAPLEGASATPSRDEVQRELNALDAPARHASAPSEASTATKQGGARNLFDVKEPVSNNGFMLAVGGATLLALLVIGGYFWWQLQPNGGLVPIAPPRGNDRPPIASQAVAPRIIPLDAPPPETSPAGLDIRASRPDPTQRPQRAARSQIRRADDANRGSFGDTRTPPSRATEQSEPLRASIPIRRGVTTPAVPATLQQAWRAYEAGDLEESYRLYQAALADNHRSIDALNGLGAIALRVGDTERASVRFRQVLSLDPENAVAMAGLGSVTPTIGANEESRLRNLIATQPNSPALQFSLGNLFAAERRWNEAQQAYFKAYSLDPQNPDYRFNLAVSLDRLGQQPLARRFYLEANELARTSPVAFDPSAALARAQALARDPAR